ncbi:hypothetical protein QR46_2236 [Giardia duodenalis assemblage B]|uniref:Uncharacterized protein n=1 Tax=Giardia duodenalis assemblage B TaxID=1394984 RepID=A0A132NUR2_GIAIN|nr:hypothetical protein QR46_2236 [Giardia intestinalis assemblage B]
MLLSFPIQPLRLRHLKSHQLLVQLTKYWQTKGKSPEDEECKFCNEARASAEILEQAHTDSSIALQEYQRYCAMVSSAHSLTKWNNNIALRLTIENHPNVWQIDAMDATEYQSADLYNDIFSSFYSSFAILFNACSAQISADVEALNIALPRSRFLFKTILELSDIIHASFAYYRSDETLNTKLVRCLCSDAFDALFSLVDLSMTELLLMTDVNRIAQGTSLDMQEFLSTISLYTNISTSLQYQLSSMHDCDAIFLSIQQDLSVRTPLLLAYFYCSSAKAMAATEDLSSAAAYVNKANSLLKQCSIKDDTSAVNLNQASQSGNVSLAIQSLQNDIASIMEKCDAVAVVDIPSPPLLSREHVREILLTDDADYEALDHYRLLLSWNHEKSQLVFTPPAKDSIGSFDAAIDDIDFENTQGDPKSTQEELDLADEKILSSKSNSISNGTNQELSVQNEEGDAMRESSWDTHPSDAASSKSPQPSILHIEHTPATNGLSVKEEHSIDLLETPSIELPNLTIEKPSKVPTPTFTNSLVERVALGDVPTDRDPGSKVPSIEGVPLPRAVPNISEPDYNNESGRPEEQLPLDLLSDNFNSVPFIHEPAAAKSDTLDNHPAPAQNLVEASTSDKSLHAPNGQEEVSPDEVPRSQDSQDMHAISNDSKEPPSDFYRETFSTATDANQNVTLQDSLPVIENRLPSTSHLSRDDSPDGMTTKDLICSNGEHDSPEQSSIEIGELDDNGSRQTTLLDEIAIGMQQSTQNECCMEGSSRITEPVRETERELDIIVNEMNGAQSDDSLKISSNTSLHSSGNEVVISRLSPSSVKPNSVVTLSTPLNADQLAATVDVNAVIAEKINPEEAMNVAAPVFMANMRSISLGSKSNLAENALSYCEEVSLHQSVNSSCVNNIVLSIGSGASLSTSADSIRKFLSDSQTSLGMNQSLSLSHSYIDKARIRTKMRLLQSRAERAILIVLLITFVIAIVCTL